MSPFGPWSPFCPLGPTRPGGPTFETRTCCLSYTKFKIKIQSCALEQYVKEPGIMRNEKLEDEHGMPVKYHMILMVKMEIHTKID